MLTWLGKRSNGSRRAARPAQAKPLPAVPEPAPVVDEEIPPPFFADADPAFLDMTEPTPAPSTPPPLPQFVPPPIQVPTVAVPARSPQDRMTLALQSLPPWPARNAPRRTDELLEILRQLDRIAGDVCSSLDDAETERFEPPRKPR